MAGLAGRLFGEGACFCLGEYLGEFPHGGVSGEDYCCYENSGFSHLGVRFRRLWGVGLHRIGCWQA